MSRYFDALNRLRRSREAASNSDARPGGRAELVAGPGLEESAAGSHLPFPELQLASRQSSYATLLDHLRASRKATSTPGVVIAGVSEGEPVHEIVAGVEIQAQRQGVSFKRGHLSLSTGARVLHLSSARFPRETPSPASAVGRESLQLEGLQGTDALRRSLSKAAAGSELLLIEAPPIGSSVEAGLLAAACGGLVVVAEMLVTKRSALNEAIGRARMSGCEILGVVLAGTKRSLPRWIERFLDG